MIFEGFNILEKFKFYLNSEKLNIQSMNKFPSNNYNVDENIEFNGSHIGNITVNSGRIFIFRGTLNGDLHIFKGAQVIIFGKIKGQVYSNEFLDIRKHAEIEGDVNAVGFKIQHGAKLTGTLSSNNNTMYQNKYI